MTPTPTMYLIWRVLLWLGTIGGAGFLLGYPLLAPFRRSEAGWHLMTFTAGVALLFLYLLLGNYGVTRQWGPFVQACIAIGIAALLVAAVYWRITILLRAQLRRRR